MEWIDVRSKSKWPELRSKDDFVVCVITDGHDVGMGFFGYRFDGDREPGFCPVDRKHQPDLMFPTHWMPVFPLPGA